jgi:hypothetical protein
VTAAPGADPALYAFWRLTPPPEELATQDWPRVRAAMLPEAAVALDRLMELGAATLAAADRGITRAGMGPRFCAAAMSRAVWDAHEGELVTLLDQSSWLPGGTIDDGRVMVIWRRWSGTLCGHAAHRPQARRVLPGTIYIATDTGTVSVAAGASDDDTAVAWVG